MKNRNHLLALLALLLTGTARAQVPVLINYQGRVAVGGVNFDSATAGHPGQFKFALVNADGTQSFWSNDRSSANGSEPGSPVALPVTKGLYSVLLGDNSLGATMRTIGAPDVAHADVRLRVWFDDGTNGFQLLAPDQRLAPAAYIADETVTSASLAPNLILPGTTTGTFSGNGSALTSVTAANVVPGAIIAPSFMAGAPVAGQVLGYNGTGLTWTAPGGGVFALNGTNAYYNGGNVGIGTMSPTAKLDVRGSITLESGGSPTIFTGTGNSELNRYLGVGNSPTLQTASGLKAGGILVADSYSYANPGKNDLVVKGNIGVGGRVGIGTGLTIPAVKFTVQTVPGLGLNNEYGIEHTDGTVRLTSYINGFSGAFGTRSDHPLNFFVNNGSASMTIDRAENVGVGTDTPTHRLSIAGGPAWTANGWIGAVALDNASAIGWKPNSAGQSFGIGHTSGGLALFHTASAPATAGSSAIYDMFIADTGNVGIGTLSPGAKLHAVATGLGGTAVLGVGSGFGAGVKGQSSLGAAIYADGNAGQTREKGGFAKAMLFVRSDGVITRGFNSYLSGDAATTPPCGFSVEKIGQFTGVAYIIGFGFRVDDRFVSVTPSPLVTYYGLGSQGADQSKIRLDSGSTDFTVILY